jgi:hypothetical protein
MRAKKALKKLLSPPKKSILKLAKVVAERADVMRLPLDHPSMRRAAIRFTFAQGNHVVKVEVYEKGAIAVTFEGEGSPTLTYSRQVSKPHEVSEVLDDVRKHLFRGSPISVAEPDAVL